MGKTLYLECSSGIAGDMCAAALLDLGVSEKRLREALATLPVANEFEVKVSRVEKNGLAACDFDVVLDAEHQTHDHDMAYLYGHLSGEGHEGQQDHASGHGHEHVCGCDDDGQHGHEHGHECDHVYGHDHGVGHDHDDRQHAPIAYDHAHAYHHTHRTLADVTSIVNASQLSVHAKELALKVFSLLAQAEAAAHGTTPEEVHFHEVGATDSIVDICAVAICLDELGVDRIIVPGLTEGTGTVRCAHGIMPVPVPAVVHACRIGGVALTSSRVQGELVTPTGAAIAAAVRTSDALPARYAVQAVGTGAGKRSYTGCSGVLRAFIIEPSERAHSSESAEPVQPACPAEPTLPHTSYATEPPAVVAQIDADLDDCTGEALGYTIEQLLKAGARDAHAIPTVMKKGRPGWQLQVICTSDDVERLAALIFENTTTIGLRVHETRRIALPRRADRVATPYGPVDVKVVTLPNGVERAYPEHASVAAACARTGADYQSVFRSAVAAANKNQ